MNRAPRKPIRLPAASYGVPGSVGLITLTTWRRTPVFRSPQLAAIAHEQLGLWHGREGTQVLVWCVMPDHVHAVIQVGAVNLLTVVRKYRTYVSRHAHNAGVHHALWQERFHDHGVRQTEKMDDLIAYVVGNPVEAGLVNEWREWPWTGGELLDTGL
jgi:putative transposase